MTTQNAPTYRTGKERAEAANEYTLRLEGIIDLASSMECEQFEKPDDLHEDFVDDVYQGWKKRHDESMRPVFAAFNGVDMNDIKDDEFAHYLFQKNLFGYVARFATPVYLHAEENSWSYSWGHYTFNWFYADTIEECWALAVEWSKRHKAEAIQKTAAKTQHTAAD